ncbi:MAG: PAS domain-containing protein [Rickettsiales bacterium]
MTDQSSFRERRLTVRLLAYWERLRRGKVMPTEEDIDPDDIEDLWENCFLVHVTDIDKPDYNYTYLGKAIDEAYRGHLSESEASGMVCPQAKWLKEHYLKIVETRKPIVEEGEFTNLNNKIVKFRQCLLPLGTGDEVKAIFGGMRYKIYD